MLLGSMNTPICNRKEYEMTLRALRSEDSAGVLLSGETGVGKSEMVRNLLTHGDSTMPIIRLICSSALTDSPYGALAPLLANIGEHINDVIVIREARAVVEGYLDKDEQQKNALIVVEDAQFIDSASAFVLGQLVRSGSVKLLVLSNEEHQDPMSLEALMSVARLTRVRVEALTVDEVADYCSARLGGQLCLGSARIVHHATAGFHALVQGYIELAIRQDALVKTKNSWVLKQHKLKIDEHAVEDVREILRRQNLAHQSVVEMLSLCGPLTLNQLDSLGLRDSFEQQKTTLVRIQDDKAWLTSSYYANGIRQGLLPGYKLALYEKACSVLGDHLPPNPQIAQVAIDLGRELTEEHIERILCTANSEHNYSLALEIMDHWNGETRDQWTVQRIRALLGAGLFHTAARIPMFSSSDEIDDGSVLRQNLECAVRWFQTSPLDSNEEVQVREIADFAMQQLETVNGSPKSWLDCHMVSRIQRARDSYRKGNLSEALSLANIEVVVDSYLAPAINYRISLVVITVRSLIVIGAYDEAHTVLDQVVFTTEEEIALCHGTLQLLRALVLAHQGRVIEAQSLLVDASAELTVYDPESLSALCTVLNATTGAEDARQIPLTVGRSIKSIVPRSYELSTRLMAYGAQFWWHQDQLESLLVNELQANNPSVEVIDDLLDRGSEHGVILHSQLNYLVWNYSRNDKLRARSSSFYAQLTVPDDCKSVEIQRQIVLRSSSNEVLQMESYARELYVSGERVPALELYTSIVDYWTTKYDPRNRGFAIRKMHSWLREVNQEPWGIIAQTLSSSGLTAREEEIVDLVRQGMGNHEIARMLTVSQRTVEGHLYRVYAKLGITKRAELNLSE